MSWWRRLTLLPIACLALMSQGCATTTGSGVTDIDPAAVACRAFAPVAWSKDDTDETIVAVKQHNARWHALCGGKT